MKVIDIATLARESGVPASTLRHYERIGLIRSVGRHGLRRVFDADVRQRLAFIALGRAAGFALAEIAPMFSPDGRLRVDRALLARRADEIERSIRRLGALRDGLRHAAACPARNHLECPTFQRLLQRAAVKAATTRAPATLPPARAARRRAGR
jgi:DNA-binding transcriptional MerR regulator